MSACSVCVDGRMGYVESLVAGGRSMKSVAAETGLAYDSIRRHVANHVAPKAAPPVAPTTTTLPAGASAYDSMRRRLDVLNAMDESRMSSRDRIQHSEEIRRTAESLDKLTPIDPNAGTLRVQDIAGLPEFMADVFRLGEKYPMIRADLKAMRERHFPETGDDTETTNTTEAA